MEITLELVERLQEKAPVSYAQAKQALEYSEGNLLDAMIYLEENGAIPRRESAYYSTKDPQQPPPPPSPQDSPKPQSLPQRAAKKRQSFFRTMRRWLVENELEIWRRSEPVTSVPVLFLILALVVAFWVMAVLLVLGLFLGFRYQFSGPDLSREELNGVMENVATTAEDMGRRVVEERKAQHDKHRK